MREGEGDGQQFEVISLAIIDRLLRSSQRSKRITHFLFFDWQFDFYCFPSKTKVMKHSNAVMYLLFFVLITLLWGFPFCLFAPTLFPHSSLTLILIKN